MKNVRILAPVLVGLLVSSTTASARDLCWSVDGTRTVKLFRVKSLRPGSAVPVSGAAQNGLEIHPITGVALVNSTGSQIRLGLTAVGTNTPESPTNYTEGVVLNASLQGNSTRDVDGDIHVGVWSPIDCSMVVLP